MKRCRVTLLAVLIAFAACGGDADDSGSDGVNDDAATGGGNSSEVGDAGFDTGFDEGNLPAGFPSELIPPSYTSGQILNMGELEVIAFNSEQSFDDALAHYTGLLGDGQLIEAGGSRQAQWLEGPDWAVALFKSADEPLQISFTEIEQ
jgi:hypothetical protein